MTHKKKVHRSDRLHECVPLVGGNHVIYGWSSLVPLLLEGVDADGVLEDDGAALGVVVELHGVVVDGAGVVGGVHQQLAVVRVQRVQVKPEKEICSMKHYEGQP